MIVHIGFPRCGSTSLQRMLVASDARFLGCDPKAPLGAMYSPVVGDVLERELRLGGGATFVRAAAALAAHLSTEDAADLVLSNENLCHRLTPWDVPTEDKLARLGRIVPPGSTIVIVHRPVQDFLVSLHRNHLGMGYTRSLVELVDELVLLGELGTLGDLHLGRLVERIRADFAEPRVVLADLTAPDVLGRLLDVLGIARPPAVPHENAGVDAPRAAAMLQANRTAPAEVGLLDWLELHRFVGADAVADADRFRVARRRRTHRDLGPAVAGLEEVDPAGVRWPTAVSVLATENRTSLAELAGAADVTVLGT